MLIYRLAQVEGDKRSKEWVQLTLLSLQDDGNKPNVDIIQLPKLVFQQMAASLEHNGLPFTKWVEA